MSNLVVLVPVLSRPQNVQPLVESLVANTDADFRLVFVCSPDDDEERTACRATEADVIVVAWQPGRADFAKKINLAFSLTDEKWLFQAADDLAFGKGWDTAAFAEAARHKVGVVGTNDLHNPSVMRGKHSTHTLFSREYIETYGGTVDNSGVVFSEAYCHQFTDTEFIETATMRKQFVFAARSIVEHRHPHWGLAPMDDTYEKATKDTKEDGALFARRRLVVQGRRRP